MANIADEILTDEQIEQLLEEAEARLSNTAHCTLAPVPQSASILHRLPKSSSALTQTQYLKDDRGVARANPGAIIPEEQRKLANELRNVQASEEPKRVNDQTTAGADWFNLPKTEVTPQLKRDFQLIEMRSVLDPHRHYKKNSRRGKIPTFSQVGTVIEGPTEFFSARINKKDRAKNFTDEAMKSEQQSGRFQRKYNEIQQTKTSGKKAHYKKLMAKRKKRP